MRGLISASSCASKSGYSLAEIADILSQNGLSIEKATLAAYMRSAGVSVWAIRAAQRQRAGASSGGAQPNGGAQGAQAAGTDYGGALVAAAQAADFFADAF